MADPPEAIFSYWAVTSNNQNISKDGFICNVDFISKDGFFY